MYLCLRSPGANGYPDTDIGCLKFLSGDIDVKKEYEKEHFKFESNNTELAITLKRHIYAGSLLAAIFKASQHVLHHDRSVNAFSKYGLRTSERDALMDTMLYMAMNHFFELM